MWLLKSSRSASAVPAQSITADSATIDIQVCRIAFPPRKFSAEFLCGKI
jgi:hypothetical protein